jgi:CARDB
MRRKIHAVLFPLLALAGAAQAADRVAEVEITQNYILPPTIVVSANQIGYTKAMTNRVDWDFGLSGHCTQHNQLVSSWMWITPNPTGDRWGTSWDFKWLSENSIFERTTRRGANLSAADKAKAVDACNDYLAQQMAHGKSKAWVLSQEHKIDGPLLYLANHEVECVGSSCPGCVHNHQSKGKKIELLNPVICQKSPILIPGSLTAPPKPPIPPGPSDLKQAFGVTAAKLWVNPKQASVVTEAKLTVSGEITANGPGKVTYRVVHNGGKGPLSMLNFSQAKTATLSFPLTVKCPKDSDAGSTKTAKKGPSAGIGGFAAAPPNVKNGSLYLEIVSPAAGKKKSNDVAYSVTCKETGTLVTPLPDLVIAKARLVPAASVAGTAVVEVAVRNRGAAGAGPSQVEVAGTVGGAAKTWTGPLPALAVGQVAEIKILLVARGQVAPPLALRADASHEVKESNESNNKWTLQ